MYKLWLWRSKFSGLAPCSVAYCLELSAVCVLCADKNFFLQVFVEILRLIYIID